MCRRKLAATPKVCLTDTARGVLCGPVLFTGTFTELSLCNGVKPRERILAGAQSKGDQSQDAGDPKCLTCRN
jgi:hypothetical protein